jgi:tryptophan synthase alpha chain
LVRRVRCFTRLPIAVGFGISLPGHVSALSSIVDAAVVGSALVAEVEKAMKTKLGAEPAATEVAQRIRLLKHAAGQGIGGRGIDYA